MSAFEKGDRVEVDYPKWGRTYTGTVSHLYGHEGDGYNGPGVCVLVESVSTGGKIGEGLRVYTGVEWVTAVH